MSDRIIKLLSEEVNLTNASNFSGAQLVRLRNSSAATSYSIVIKDGATITGSISIYPGEVLFVRKKAAETIESNAPAGNQDIRMINVGFGD